MSEPRCLLGNWIAEPRRGKGAGVLRDGQDRKERSRAGLGPGVHSAGGRGAEWLPMDHPQQIRNLRATAFSVSCKTPNL